MKRVALAALLLLTVAACNHQPPAPATAPVNEEAALTGIPSYPRAYPVALPVPVATTPPPSAAPSETTTVAAAVPATEVNAASAAGNVPPPEENSPSSTPAGADTAAPPSEAPPMPPPVTGTETSSLPANAAVATPASVADASQVVVLETSFGRIVIELDDFAAPKTCANFRRLVGSGFYNGTIFHRVIPNFIIQGGDPNTRGTQRTTYGLGDPGYTLPPEIKLLHDQGAVAMARLPDGVNPQRYSNGSQFYICVVACPSLDHQYTVFGHVIAGLDAVSRIASAPADRRNDPFERLNLQASLETRDRALRESAATGPVSDP